MILAVDSTTLVLLLNPASNPPADPETGEPVIFAAERVAAMIASLGAGDTLIIPAPVLAEVLVEAGEGGPDILSQLRDTARVRIEPFGERAAVEVAAMTREAKATGDKRGGSSKAWQQVKVDRQIIAVARVAGADRLYSDDRQLASFARGLGMDVVSTWDLPVPATETNLFTSVGLPPGGAPDPALVLQKGSSLPVSAALSIKRVLNLDEPDGSEA